MAPRKVDSSPKKAAEKKPRGRQKKVKPVLKTPTVVTVKPKLPTTNTADENVESEVILDKDVKEHEKPVVKRKYVRKNIANNKKATTKQAPVKKRGLARSPTKKDTFVKTSSIGENDAKCDKFPQVDPDYYKICLANDVIKFHFPNTSKYVKEQPIEQVLQENKTIVKKKQVSNIKIDLKNNVTNGSKPTTKTPGNTKKCRRPKKVSTTTTSQESECKPTLPSKDDDNNIIDNTNNAKQSPKRSTISKKPRKPNLASKDDSNNIKPTKKSEQSTKQKRSLPKQIPKMNSPEEIDCKANLTSKGKISKDDENNIIGNTNNAEQSPKCKTISKKATKESECKPNLASKDDSNNIKPTKKSKQKQSLPKQIPKANSSEEIDCKANLTSKDKISKDYDNNIIGNTNNSEQSPKHKTISKKATKESECKPNLESKDNADDNRIEPKKAKHKRNPKLSLNRKHVKAGVLSFFNKDKEICSSEILKNCNKNQVMITDASIENYNVDKCVDNSIEQASVSSCLSFTKDISSSSNCSFVTIRSNGLHCFDNKIPVVKLNKIKKKIQNKSISSDGNNRDEGSETDVADYNLFESTVHDRQYSLGLKCRLSRSSSSSSEQNKMDNCPTIEANVADVTQSALRLSTSSTSSSSSSSRSSSSSSSSTSTSGSMMRKNIDNGLTFENLEGDEKKSASVDDELKTVLRKLNLNNKKCDFNRIKLSNNTFENTMNKSQVKNLQDNMFKNDDLKEETVLRSQCQSIIQLEIDDVDKYFNHPEPQETADIPRSETPETYYSKESQVITGTSDRNEECIKHTNNNHQQHCPAEVVDAVAANEIAEKIDGNCYPTNKSNYNSVCDNDDDDALSLFAESITGLESCKRNSTLNQEMSKPEEYVPEQPHTVLPRKSIIYQPTKISNNNTNLQEDCTIYEDRIGNFSSNLKSENIVLQNTRNPNAPRLMALYYRPEQRTKSLVLKGYCFYYIISKCKKPNCKYIHEYPNVIDVKNTLKKLTEESFIQEYMLWRDWAQIRRKYGLCFVEECIRRELTRILVEIAIDFINKSLKHKEDNALKLEVVDNVLMYLNQVDLSICDDLLKYIIAKPYFDKVMLCDYFMSVIATSQNFSRFKFVFVKLTDFIYRDGRTFSVDVAESILERFCILPYDYSLARALLNILKNTNVTVFSNAKISDLEKQLQTANSDLYRELKLLKDRALVCQPVMDNFGHNMDKNIIKTSTNASDMTDVNKTPIQTTFKRTVDIHNLQQLGLSNKTNTMKKTTTHVMNPPMKWTPPGISRNDEHANLSNTAENGPKKWKWKDRSIFDTCFKRNLNASFPAWPQRAPFKRHSDQSFEGSPTKFKRNNGPYNSQRDLL